MQRTKLMQELWIESEKAEAQGNVRTARLFEVAGNLVEATFTTGSLEESLANAIRDAWPDAWVNIAK